MNNSDTELSAHFAFGENWQDFARSLTDEGLERAIRDLRVFLGDAIQGRTFLDVGSGSGLHSLAALRLGASRVFALDLDPLSVSTTRGVLERFATASTWRAEQLSALSLKPSELGTFDVVYSWGVLHHTGNMRQAIESVAQMVAPGGLLALALYERSLFCPVWRVEKWGYSHLPAILQRLARLLYTGLYRTAQRVADHRVPKTERERGMNLSHDIHDWLGGYPYESISSADCLHFLEARSFVPVKVLTRKPRALGLFGTGCSEFVFQRK